MLQANQWHYDRQALRAEGVVNFSIMLQNPGNTDQSTSAVDEEIKRKINQT